jgi:hypothetical protein
MGQQKKGKKAGGQQQAAAAAAALPPVAPAGAAAAAGGTGAAAAGAEPSLSALQELEQKKKRLSTQLKDVERQVGCRSRQTVRRVVVHFNRLCCRHAHSCAVVMPHSASDDSLRVTHRARPCADLRP